VTPPRPGALRLHTRAEGAKPPRPPLGLAAWSPTADAIAVLLDAGDDATAIAGIVAQLPDGASLPPGTPVLVLAKAADLRPFWRVFARDVTIPRAARCSALLARGYVDIGADVDLAWGYAPELIP
jgi:hypothetical protein